MSKELRIIPFHSKAIGLTESGMEAVGAEFGGGIYNQGTLTLRDSIITENYDGGGAASSTAPKSPSKTAPSVATERIIPPESKAAAF